MPIEVSEKEMLYRFGDGLKQAAARAGEFYRSPNERRPQLFIDFIQGIKVAAGSAHQLYFAQENPKWLELRDKLEQVIEIGRSFPPSTDNRNLVWLKIKSLLEALETSGSKLGTSKAMTRTDVLANLVGRELRNKIQSQIEDANKAPEILIDK